MFSLRSYLLSAFAALSVFAATSQPASALVSTYTSNGEVYKVVEYVSSDAENVRVSTVLKGPAARDTFAARTIPIKQSRLTAWVKPNYGSLIKTNLWWMGFAATMAAAGWVYDSATLGVAVADPTAQVGSFWMTDNYNYYSFLAVGSTPLEACKNLANHSASLGNYRSVTEFFVSGSGTYYQCNIKAINNSGNPQNYTSNVQKNNCTGWPYPFGSDQWPSRVNTCEGALPAPQPVSDADLQNAINAQLAADPAYAATAFTDPATGKGYADLFDPVPYIPGLSAADEALVNCYISGQLQMVDSQTACYVATQAEYDRVKQQADALAAGKTPEATADALNSELEQPLTQAQYEETNKKYSDAIADVTADVNAKNESDYSDIDDKFNDLDGIITDLPNTTLPAPADISVPQYVDCQQLHLSDGNGHELDFPSAAQCAKIETFKQGFGYFLALSVVFLLGMQLLTRPHG